MQADGMKVKKMPGKVTNIAKIFEMQQSPPSLCQGQNTG